MGYRSVAIANAVNVGETDRYENVRQEAARRSKKGKESQTNCGHSINSAVGSVIEASRSKATFTSTNDAPVRERWRAHSRQRLGSKNTSASRVIMYTTALVAWLSAIAMSSAHARYVRLFSSAMNAMIMRSSAKIFLKNMYQYAWYATEENVTKIPARKAPPFPMLRRR